MVFSDRVFDHDGFGDSFQGGGYSGFVETGCLQPLPEYLAALGDLLVDAIDVNEVAGVTGVGHAVTLT